MNILDSEMLGGKGPNLEFAALPRMIMCSEGDWPKTSEYMPYSFFSMPEFFIETVCDVTNTWWFFDYYQLLQYNTPERIHGFSAQLISLAGQVAAARIFGSDNTLNLYESTTVPEEMRTARNLKCDIVHTLLHLSSKVNQVAANQKCLAVVGI